MPFLIIGRCGGSMAARQRGYAAWVGLVLLGAAVLVSAQEPRWAEVRLQPQMTLRAKEPINLPPALRSVIERKDSGRQLEILDLQGRELTQQTGPRVEGGAVILDTPTDRAIIIRPDRVEQMRLPQDQLRVSLPGGMVIPAPAGARPTWFQLTFGASPVPATWNEQLRRYTTRLWFGLRASEHATPGADPPEPVPVRIGLVGLNAEDLEPFRLERAGLEHERSMEFQFLPTTGQPTLQIRSSVTEVDMELDVPPRIELRPTHPELAGFGLGRVELVVAHILPHGPATPVARDLPVSLEIEGRATPEPARVEIVRGESETRFALRSSGLGPVTVRVRAEGFSDSARLHQYFPLGPPLAALLGGMLGGYARSFVPKARRRSTGRRILEGLVVAMIAYVASVLGVAHLGVPAAVAATEAGAFLTGALTGFCGVVVIEKLTRAVPALATATSSGAPDA